MPFCSLKFANFCILSWASLRLSFKNCIVIYLENTRSFTCWTFVMWGTYERRVGGCLPYKTSNSVSFVDSFHEELNQNSAKVSRLFHSLGLRHTKHLRWQRVCWGSYRWKFSEKELNIWMYMWFIWNCCCGG